MAKKGETRNRLMAVALKLFSEDGYYATTTKRIAQEAGVNELTLFRHFGSKENLFQETTENVVQEIGVKHEIDTLKNQDFEVSIIQFAKDYLDLCVQNKDLYKIQLRLKDNEHEFVKLKLSREFAQVLEIYFKELVEINMIEGCPEKMAVTFINSILGAFTVHLVTANTFSEIELNELVEEHAKQFAAYYKK